MTFSAQIGVMTTYSIECMPTFVLFKHGKEVVGNARNTTSNCFQARVTGADDVELAKLIKKHK